MYYLECFLVKVSSLSLGISMYFGHPRYDIKHKHRLHNSHPKLFLNREASFPITVEVIINESTGKKYT